MEQAYTRKGDLDRKQEEEKGKKKRLKCFGMKSEIGTREKHYTVAAAKEEARKGFSNERA